MKDNKNEKDKRKQQEILGNTFGYIMQNTRQIQINPRDKHLFRICSG